MQTPIDRERGVYLVETYSDLILRLSYTYLGSTHDAQDICQNVLLRLMVDDRKFESPTHEKAFIIRMTANACKDELRLIKRKRTCTLEACAETPAPEVAADGMLEQVARLPQKYREVIFLHYYEGYTVRELASLLQRPENTISTHLRRGREKLKDLLGGFCYEGISG